MDSELSVTENDLHLLNLSFRCLRILLKDVRHLLVYFGLDLADGPKKDRHYADPYHAKEALEHSRGL